MIVTVIICTWNRAEILDQTLTEFQRVSIPPGTEWELLVVNNNSTDATDAVLEKHAQFLPIGRHFEPTPGKANAANLAMRKALGELLIWTDDDVSPCGDWLTAYLRAAAESPEAGVFGGPIEPWFDGSPPEWLLRVQSQIGNAFGVRDFGEAPLPLSHTVIPFGANFAVRTELQRRFPFDPALGVAERRRIGGYETSVIRRMLSSGIAGQWVPQARVGHFVRRETQSVKFLRRYYAAQGHAAALKGEFEADGGARLFGRARWLVRRAIEAEVRYRWSRLSSAPEVWIEHLIESSQLWGSLRR